MTVITTSHRFVLTLGLLLSVAKAQLITISDLPTCALPCATNAALAVGCTLNDTACLCSHPGFRTSTIDCSRKNGQCPIEDRGSIVGVLAGMCLSTPPSLPTSSSSSQTTTSNTQTTSANTPSSSSASSSSATSSSSSSSTFTTTSATSSSTTSSSSTTTTTSDTSISASSTVVVVQTVIVPPTSLASSSTRSLDSEKTMIMAFVSLIGMAAGGWVVL